MNIKIIGTAHVSERSVEDVKNTIIEENPEVVAVELDYRRYMRLTRDENQNTSILDIIKNGLKTGSLSVIIAGVILTYLQNKAGEDIGIKPGSDMIAAIKTAEEIGAKVVLIDRDIEITLSRAMNAMSLFEKLKLIFNIFLSSFKMKDIDIEDLKKKDVLKKIMKEFKRIAPNAYKVIVDERDAYMAYRLLNIDSEKIVAVVGAGHKKGIEDYLKNPEKIPPIYKLLNTKIKDRNPINKIFLLSLLFITFLLLKILVVKGCI
ncbi:TraB determinant protein [Methanothermus fervidus DSM 2088]|uniref:TraB determinant protein n=1 Tax=Methanothermus fervidus (strain ATCC 43054 / DSM 2088 / JCM 10308 / V24 S) TaxID=523846 RepID=E3GWV6_METFV|nr:TraB/GumN family protein [Methanothermus fervidus]ADP78025.1 TraB determinant protein [Methanothermus fervidus DSM 2088]